MEIAETDQQPCGTYNMAITKTALVLVLACASSLAWENLPSIPANRRAEYYLQHNDGGYKFGYDTGEGQSALASADAANQVKGEYSYIDETGQRVNWAYTAGEEGYVPVMSGGGASGSFGAKTSGFGSRAYSAPTGVIPSYSASATSADADYDENADASYNFNIDTAAYKRTESSDAKGNIQGQYSYTSPVGGSHAVSYIAGENTGFVVTSDASKSSSGSAASSSGYEYRAPQQTYLPPAASYAGAAAADGQTQVNPDGSFQFSYTTGDHSHHAVADAANNVRGSYSFTSKDDGQTRKVDYLAGPSTGYVATGAHLPVAPAVASAVKSYTAGSYSAGRQSAKIGGDAHTSVNADGSFSYAYTTGDHSKQEVADAGNNVRGSYSFTSKDDGKTRKVDYVAGAATGFVATGDHLPVAPRPSAVGVKSAASFASVSNAGYSSGNSGYAAPAQSGAQSDGSYSFSYNTGDHSHHAAAGPAGNVRGSYSFVADDGVNRKVDYTASADKGFVAKGAHLPVAPVAASSGGFSAHSSGSSDSGYQYQAPVAASSSYAAHTDDSGSNDDGSYSYSYETGSSAKQESADAKGNVAGSFSYVGGDGVNRKLTYTAREGEGFVAKGDHLPVAPVAGQEIGLTSPNAFAHPDLFANSVVTDSASAGHGSSSGQVMASKDGAYSYSYSTGGQQGASAVPTYSAKTHSASGNVKSAGHSGSSSFGSQQSTGQVMASKDGAYSYSYSTGGQSAAQAAPSYKTSSPAHNNVAASSIKSYSSNNQASSAHGSSTGQVMASKDGAYSYSYTTGGQTGSPSSYSKTSGGQTAGQTSGSVGTSGSSGQQDDGSYKFAYKTATHSHEQSSDPANNVRGSYTFTSKDDGQVRKVDYTAGAATGYVASGSHLPVAPAPVAAAFTGGRQTSNYGGGIAAAAQSNAGADGSFSYSYQTDSSSKQETADAGGNVVGSFSYVGGDGVNRKLSYTANEGGFMATGDHLPRVQPVGGASAFGTKSQAHRFSHTAGQGYSGQNLPASTSRLASGVHGVQETRDGNVVISKYLPPVNSQKFGYIFDTKA